MEATFWQLWREWRAEAPRGGEAGKVEGGRPRGQVGMGVGRATGRRTGMAAGGGVGRGLERRSQPDRHLGSSTCTQD